MSRFEFVAFCAIVTHLHLWVRSLHCGDGLAGKKMVSFALIATKDFVLMFGGHSNKEETLNIIQRYDTKNEKWEILPENVSLPKKLSSLSCHIQRYSNIKIVHCVGGFEASVPSRLHFMKNMEDLFPSKYLSMVEKRGGGKVFCFWLRQFGFGKETNLGESIGEIVTLFTADW